MTIANRLRKIITDKDMSIKVFSSLCDLSYNSLQNYLLERRVISVGALTKISANVNVNLHWLLTGEGAMYKKEMLAQPQVKDRDLNTIMKNYNKLSGEEKRDLLRRSQELVRTQMVTTMLAKLGMDETAFV